MDLLKRIQGVFFSPRPTFEGLAAKPVWIDTLVVILLALIAFNFVVLPYLQKDQLALMEDHAASIKAKRGEQVYAQMIERARKPQVVQTLVATPVFYIAALLLQSLILLILGRLLSTQGTFVQVLAALVHAGLVDKVLGNAVRLALILPRGSVMQTSTNLALFFPRLEVTSTLYVLLSQVDFFGLWAFGVLALGLAAVFKIPARKALVLSYAVWALKAAFNVGFGILGMSFLR